MKAVYNLPHLIAWMMGRKQDRTETKKVCTCQRRPLTPEERYVKSLADAVDYLERNLESPVSAEVFSKSYHLMSGHCLSRHVADRMMKAYYISRSEDITLRITRVLEEITGSRRQLNIEFACLVIWYLFRKERDIDVYPLPVLFKDIRKTLGRTDIGIFTLILRMKSTARSRAEKGSALSDGDLMDYFSEKKNWIALNFRIKHLFLYGSYADGTQSAGSDIDLLAEFEEDVLPLAMHGFVQRLKEIISKDLGKEVDIIRFEQAQTNMDLSALENIRSIF